MILPIIIKNENVARIQKYIFLGHLVLEELKITLRLKLITKNE